MDCPSCGHANEPGYAYCEECGSTLEAGSSSGAAGSVCPACRHHNPPEHTYCEECGAALATP
ncbi:MAG: zinc ribbon domain-containing protein, partial [Actinobacteria bacterium]|nr:zinc ribbon domain-containing protein [Actinomycetota bacterium]